MMKYWIATLLCTLCIGLPAHAQTPRTPQPMTILHVTGKADLAATGKPLATHQLIAHMDKISFGDAQAKVVVWEPASGLLVLQPKPAAANSMVTLSGTALGFAKPLTQPTHSGRVERFTAIPQLATHFQGRKYLLLGRSWLLAPPQLQGKSDTVVIVKYRNLTENYQFGRKLPCSGDTLYLDPATLFDMNGQVADPAQLSDFTLWWIQKSTNASKMLASFDLILADEPRLHDEVLLLLGLMQGKEPAEKLAAVSTLMEAGWGEPDAHNFEVWMALHFPDLNLGVPEQQKDRK
jgi:hypothetical protein